MPYSPDVSFANVLHMETSAERPTTEHRTLFSRSICNQSTHVESCYNTAGWPTLTSLNYAHTEDQLTLVVSYMFPGSQEVRLPKITTISRLAWDGMCRNVWAATSREFCRDGSPRGVVVLRDCIASMCFFWLPFGQRKRYGQKTQKSSTAKLQLSTTCIPANSVKRSALLFLVVMIPSCPMGFWSKNSAMNFSSNYTEQKLRKSKT